MCTYHYPFEATNKMALMIKILKNKPKPIASPPYSKALARMTEVLLIKD